jgi:hypothetical protein
LGTDFSVDVQTASGAGYPGYSYPADATAGGVTTFTGGQNQSSWLSVAPSAGATGGTVTLTASLSNLITQGITSPVTFTGTVRVRHAANSTNSLSGQNPVLIPISLTVNPILTLNLSTTALQSFAYTLGTPVTTTNPGTIIVTAKSSSTSFPYTVAPTGTANGCAWLTATTGTGIAIVGAGDTITIGINPACITGTTPALTAGTYSGNVVVTAPSAAVVTQNIPVSFVVSALPVITVAPATTANFTATINAASAPPAQVLAVNVGNGTIPLTLTGTIPSWLSAVLTPSAPTATSSASLSLSIIQTAVNSLTTASSPYTATLTIGSTQANVAPVTVTVVLTLSGQPTISVSASSQTAAYTLGNTTASTPICGAPISVTGSANGLVVTPVVSATSGGTSWITWTLTGGTTPTQATICATPSLLSTPAVAATYAGTVTFTSPGAVSAPVAISLTINAQPVISAPAPTPYTYIWGGAVPAAKAIPVTAVPSATGMTLATSGDCTWMTASLAATTAPTSINTAMVAPLTKAPGSYNCTLTVSGTGGTPSAPAMSSSTTVTLTVAPLPAFAAATTTSGISMLTFPGGNLFGYFAYLPSNSIIFHADLGYEAIVAANDANNGVYMYDFKSGHWWYTTPGTFPFVYDFTLSAWIYYFPSQTISGHYTSSPRSFVNMTTNQFFTM